MANPNIVAVATINGNMLSAAVGTGSPDTQIVTNAASSGKIFKINSLYVANIDGTASVDARAASGQRCAGRGCLHSGRRCNAAGGLCSF